MRPFKNKPLININDKSISIILVGDSPEAKLSGGARINTFISLLKPLRANIRLLSYVAYSDKLKLVTINTNDNYCATLHFPREWSRGIKGILLIIFNFIYSFYYLKYNDIVLYAGGSIIPVIPVILASKLRNKPIIYDYVDIEVEKIPRLVYKYLMKQITFIFAISHFLVEEAKENGCKKIVYVPAFVDTDVFKKNCKTGKILRRNLNLSENDIVIGYSGSLSPIEGIPILLNVVRAMHEDFPQLRLLILGTKQNPGQGDEIGDLIKELGLDEKVFFIQPVTHSKVPEFLSACDILCAPKIDCKVNRAANPIKVVEYLSMDIPTVCSSIGELPFIINDGINGFLVKPGDEFELRSKLAWIMSNPERSREIADNGRRTIIERYSLFAIRDDVKKVIMDI